MPTASTAARIAGAAIVLVSAHLALAPAPARAAQAVPLLEVVSARTDVRQVDVRVSVPPGAVELRVTRDSEEVTRAACSGHSRVVVPIGIPGPGARLVAAAYDASDTLVAEGPPLAVRARDYLPACRLNVSAGRLLKQGQGVTVRHLRGLSATVTYRSTRTGAVRRVASGAVSARAQGIALPDFYGRNILVLSMRNAWGTSWKAVTLWHLDIAPGTSRYVLVDKSDFTLYRITEDRVHSSYPVAIGMPGVPTPSGTFVLGRPQRASGVWGVLRIPLYVRSRWGTLRHGGYYIHGTNEPDSIGTEASHGCVRMYNSDIRRMRVLTWPGMRAVIRG